MSKAKLIFSLLSMLFAGHAIAGVRGLRVVMVSLDDSTFFESPAYIAFREGEAPQLSSAQNCWNQRATGGEGVSHTTRKKLPNGLTKKLALQIWSGDQKAIVEAQKILRRNDEHTGSNGYDGLFIVRVQGSSIAIRGVGAQSSTPATAVSEMMRLEWKIKSPMETASNFDLAICKAAKPMDYRFNP